MRYCFHVHPPTSSPATSGLRALRDKYESEMMPLNQQLTDLSLQLAEARKKEAQLTSTIDTLRKQVGKEKGRGSKE